MSWWAWALIALLFANSFPLWRAWYDQWFSRRRRRKTRK